MGLQIVTVAESIADLSVTGVDIKDLDKIPEEGNAMDVPVIIPKPDGFITGFRHAPVSLSSGSGRQVDVFYILTYRLLHSEIGEGMDGLFTTYPAMVALTALFLDEIIANDTLPGAVDAKPLTIPIFGPVADPVGNMFHGCDIGIEIMEFVN